MRVRPAWDQLLAELADVHQQHHTWLCQGAGLPEGAAASAETVLQPRLCCSDPGLVCGAVQNSGVSFGLVALTEGLQGHHSQGLLHSFSC